jgi:queuine tRNA-ribosyltransferase
MYDIIETVVPHMPAEKPRYLMGVGTPGNILNAVAAGIDMFDCVLPSRNARHGHLFTSEGVHQHVQRQNMKTTTTPIDKNHAIVTPVK